MSLSEICCKSVRIGLFTGRNTHAVTLLMSGLLISWCMAHIQINNILYLKSPINVNKYRQRPVWTLRLTYIIMNHLAALPCFGTIPKVDSSNYTINSIWLSEQQAAQMCNFGRKHQRYLAAMHHKIREDYLG